MLASICSPPSGPIHELFFLARCFLFQDCFPMKIHFFLSFVLFVEEISTFPNKKLFTEIPPLFLHQIFTCLRTPRVLELGCGGRSMQMSNGAYFLKNKPIFSSKKELCVYYKYSSFIALFFLQKVERSPLEIVFYLFSRVVCISIQQHV